MSILEYQEENQKSFLYLEIESVFLDAVPSLAPTPLLVAYSE